LLGLSQKVFAMRLEVDLGTLSQWERGEREATGEFMVRASRFLNAAEVA